jgi:hypothetical protein
VNALRRLPRPPRRHLPEELDFLKVEEALAWGRGLAEASPGSPAAFAEWLRARAEFEAALAESLLLARLDFIDQPADPRRRGWLEDLHRQAGARWEELRHRLDLAAWQVRALLEGAARAPWEPALRGRLALYRESNLALKERLAELALDYAGLLGSLAIERAGRSCPLAEMRHLLQGDDPTVRRAVWEARAQRLEDLRPALEDLLDETLALREQIARNADHPDWNAYRVAQGRGPRPWRPEDLLRAAAGRERAARPWDLARAEGGQRPMGAGQVLAELADGLSYHEPALARTLRLLELSGLLDLEARPGKFDLDACFWLPERRLPLLRLGALALEDDLERGLSLLLAARRAMEGEAGPPGRVLLPSCAEDLPRARGIAGGLFSEYEPGQARLMEQRVEGIRRLEACRALTVEYWGRWLHGNPGAGRVQRRRVWCAALALAFPGVKELGNAPDLEDTLFLETAFFLPDWHPPSRAALLLETEPPPTP